MNTIVELLVKHGYSVLFAPVFARQMWLPVPAILVLIAAGALAGAAAFFMLEFLCAVLREARRPRIDSLRDVRAAVSRMS